MSAPDLVIFDCDGVLVDSEPIAARAEAELISEAGYQITPEEMVERFSGLTFRDILLAVERESGTPLKATLIEEAETKVNERLRRDVIAMEGVHRVVAAVPKRCVCSNSSRVRLRLELEKTGLLPLFADAAFSVEDTASGAPKPAPDVYLHAAEQMEAAPDNTFVVEDSVHGVQAAAAAGMRVIGFTGASHSFPGHADRLTEAGAETVINRWEGFLPVLLALTRWKEA